MSGAPQHIGGDVETHQKEIICEEGTWAVPHKGTTAGTSDLGSVEGVQAAAGGYSARIRQLAFEWDPYYSQKARKR